MHRIQFTLDSTATVSSTFVSNIEFSMHRIQFTFRFDHNDSAACRTKTQWFSAFNACFSWGNMASWQKHVNKEVAKSLKKITIRSDIFQQRPVIDTDIDTMVNTGVLSKTWLGLFEIR